MEVRYIDPLKELGPLLLSVEKPGRYTGGEYGRLCGKHLHTESRVLKTVIAFPDLYEIGMSNQALRIIYNRLNNMKDISCDRAFAPAPDFEKLLRSRGLPIYGLDTGISLKHTDILMFTLGYELSITGVFSILDISGIPLRCDKRTDDDPVLIMGGPCVSNPLPYSSFIDAFWIGEAEGGFFDLTAALAEMKINGGKREALLKKITSHPSIWTKGKGKTVRAVDTDFSAGKRGHAIFPVPSMKVVHNHGAVEIMRGCPNGCRFCHAGYWYRPMRQKNADIVEAETEAFIKTGGYREITLSSLSSGDYTNLDSLIENLNSKFRGKHVSFQLPSLKVSSFSLDLLEKISEVRKSGLTFALETPLDFWQMAINKQVSAGNLVMILKEAKRRGWRGVKFYFMIGLPLEGLSQSSALKSEEEEIVSFIESIAAQTGMHFNINVGNFVPKPHTPFQRVHQLDREEAEKKLKTIRERLKPKGHKIGIQDPLVSLIEGIASRGGESAGELFEQAYLRGCRLDAWSEYFKKEIWEEILLKHDELVNRILHGKEYSEELPWACIDSGVSESYFKEEMNKSVLSEITSMCINNCKNPCGVCGKSEIVHNIIHNKANSPNLITKKSLPILDFNKRDPATYRIIFSFSKSGSAIFHPHLGILEIFFMSFIRADIPVSYTQGFNPLPRMEIPSPLTLGIKAGAEIASIETEVYFDAKLFKKNLNTFLPEGFEIQEAMNVYIPSGAKKHSLSSFLWGYAYAGLDGKPELVKAKDEKLYRESRIGPGGNVYGLERLAVLAGAPNDSSGVSFFEKFRSLYPEN